MNLDAFFYLLPYLISLALSFGIFIYSWRHRHVPGAQSYSWFIGAETLSITGFILELISPNLDSKILWDTFQWITQALIIVTFLAFAIEYTDHKLKQPDLTWGVIIAVPLIFTSIVATDGWHHLIYIDARLNAAVPFPELEYDFSNVVYAYSIYVYLATFFGIGLLFLQAFRQHGIYRLQFAVIAVGFLIPVALSIFSLININITPERDNTPFTFAAGNLIVAWGLFRYRLFDIAPIARERIVDNMVDPVFVLDPMNRVVDVNDAALTLMGKQTSDVIGHSSSKFLDRLPMLAELLEDSQEQKKEVSIKRKGETSFFDIGISRITSRRGRLLGRILVARDVTRLKNLEMNYRALSEELEERVQERTEELRKSAERYRAVVEHQTEHIVRWTPDRKRTFVNEAYCRYYGLSMEQALQVDFMQLIQGEDRHAVEEKIRRLISGESDFETEIHRVRKPDGSFCWQEWTDQAIRDATGKVIEFQSIGRDITIQKAAEEALRASEERFSKAFRASPIIVVIARVSDATLLEVNEAFEKISGYTRAEAIGRSSLDLGIWARPADRDRIMPVLLSTGEIRNEEIQYRSKDGRIVTCLLSADIVELEGEKCILGTVQDISARKIAEERILRLNRLYATISQINQTIVHARDKESLFRDICRVAIDHGQFCMAWIGLTCEGHLLPFVFAGNEQGYLENVDINIQDTVHGRGPTGTAVREGRCIICQDIANDPRMSPWREAALSRGFRSSAAVPIREHGQVIGALTVYADEVNGFDSENEELLEQIGQDVSFALDSLEAERRRQMAERNLTEAYDTTLEGWSMALELRDKETEGHSRRVTKTTLVVARAMGLDEDALVHVRYGSLLHDIGKMGIPDEILRKNGPLTDEERIIVKKHPDTAYELLKNIPYLEQALEIPYSHHEKWDGTGYPRGLKADEIPLSARIFAVVDVWDALSSDRPYRPGWEAEQVVEYLKAESGKHFDPHVVEVFLKLLNAGEV